MKRKWVIYDVISANPNADPADLRKTLMKRGHRATVQEMAEYQQARGDNQPVPPAASQ